MNKDIDEKATDADVIAALKKKGFDFDQNKAQEKSRSSDVEGSLQASVVERDFGGSFSRPKIEASIQ